VPLDEVRRVHAPALQAAPQRREQPNREPGQPEAFYRLA
jgi:hypothetical protein